MTKDQKIARYHELHQMKLNHNLTMVGHDELIQLGDDIIGMYKKCVDISEVTDEELEAWEYQ